MPKELNRDEYLHLLKSENKMDGYKPFRNSDGEGDNTFYLLTDKQYRACRYYLYEGVFNTYTAYNAYGDIEFNKNNIRFTFDNCFVELSDSGNWSIRWDRNWLSFSDLKIEMNDIEQLINSGEV